MNLCLKQNTKTVVAFAIVLSTMLGFAAATPDHAIPGCKGRAVYKVAFHNLLTAKNFGSLIPRGGLVYSPLAGVSHSNRISLFTIRGFASKAVELIAEQGVNSLFIRKAKFIRWKTGEVRSVVDAGAPTMPGTATVLRLSVDCRNPSLTVIGMIAPSPDWIVQINNFLTYDLSDGEFIKYAAGDLIAYDSGVDDGNQFTPPANLSLDIPTVPQKNIAPLVEDDTDRFEGRVVGRYTIRRIYYRKH